MPQMAPMSWLILFIMFAVTLMGFTIMLYPMLPQFKKTFNKNMMLHSPILNWKW